MGFELEDVDLYNLKMAVEEPMMMVVMSCTVKWSLVVSRMLMNIEPMVQEYRSVALLG